MQPSRRVCLLALFLMACFLPVRKIHADPLTITTSPAGATVEINGVAAGTTPYSIDYPGGYFHKTHTAFGTRLEHAITVRVSKEGYLPQQITLTEGPFEWVAVTGRRRGNYFLLKSNHFEVKLDANTRHDRENVSLFGREGPMPPVSVENARSGEGKNSESGSVSIASEPANAEIYIDGKFVGQTPSTLRVQAGSHHVEVRIQGRQSWDRQLDVLKDSQLSLHAVFSDQH